MSTHSIIALEQDNGSIISIYCHFDGYESGVGKILKNDYTELKDIQNLISLGNLSSLDGQPVAYHRDRGEPWAKNKPVHFKNINNLMNQCDREAYTYVWAEGTWQTFR
ncbi:MAG: hypothetical protein HN790_07210 [Methylococcales bacterium]|jgi:hypothetical protein|nr:hypothetical protein [Methylococcales bacterium]